MALTFLKRVSRGCIFNIYNYLAFGVAASLWNDNYLSSHNQIEPVTVGPNPAALHVRITGRKYDTHKKGLHSSK